MIPAAKRRRSSRPYSDRRGLIGLTPTPPLATLNPGPVLPIFSFAPVGNIETKFSQKMCVCVCVIIFAVPITKLFAWGKGDSGGHVLRETTSRGLCGLVCLSHTSERGEEGDCVKEGGGGEGG